MKLTLADAVAGELVEKLGPCCERIEIAGSVRRRAVEVKDIELVCVPIVVPDTQGQLFGGTAAHATATGGSTKNLLLEKVSAWKTARTLAPRLSKTGVACWGERYVRAWYHRVLPQGIRDVYGVAVDIFMVLPPAQFGLIYAIRTGDSEFSMQLLARLKRGTFGGHSEGGVYYKGNGEMVPMVDEESVFKAAGWEWMPPEKRNRKAEGPRTDDRQPKELPVQKTEGLTPCSKHDWSGPLVDVGGGVERASCVRCRAVHEEV